MTYPIPLSCPACTKPMRVTGLTCPHCETSIRGQFEVSGLHRLTGEQLQFVEVFLRCRGNIKEVERDLKISYPTVRSRLDQVIQSMGYPLQREESSEPSHGREEVLDALGRGELSFEDALQILKGEK